MPQRRKDNKKRVLKEGEYQRSNGTFEYKWRDKQGKRHSLYAKTLEELREKESALLKNILDGVRTADKSLTVNDLYHRWLSIKRGLRDSTLDRYKEVYTRYVEPQFGLIKLTDLKKSDVKAYYNYLVEHRGLSISTVDGVHAVLHQVLDVAVDDELIRSNPADKGNCQMNARQKRRARPGGRAPLVSR